MATWKKVVVVALAAVTAVLAGIRPGDRGRGGPIGAAGRGGAAGY